MGGKLLLLLYIQSKVVMQPAGNEPKLSSLHELYLLALLKLSFAGTSSYDEYLMSSDVQNF